MELRAESFIKHVGKHQLKSNKKILYISGYYAVHSTFDL